MPTKSPGLPKVCSSCGDPFLAHRSTARYCPLCNTDTARQQRKRALELLQRLRSIDLDYLERCYARGYYEPIEAAADALLMTSCELSKRRWPVLGLHDVEADVYSLDSRFRITHTHGDERTFFLPRKAHRPKTVSIDPRHDPRFIDAAFGEVDNEQSREHPRIAA